MGRLTTHVLDTANGCPADGVRIELFAADGDAVRPLAAGVTNADGRCDRAFLDGASFARGIYELRFHAGDYFRRRGVELPDPAFLDVVPIRFGISTDQHYHVPLLISPFGYSTYRGS